MKHNPRASVCISALATSALLAIAAPASATGYGATHYVREVWVNGGTWDQIVLDTTTGGGKCKKNGGGYLTVGVDPTSETGARMLKLATAALLAGKKIQVWVNDDGASNDPKGYCKAQYVHLWR
jgi:hypothetical protein